MRRNVDVVDHFSTLVAAGCTVSNIHAGNNHLKHAFSLRGDLTRPLEKVVDAAGVIEQ